MRDNYVQNITKMDSDSENVSTKQCWSENFD